MYILKDFLTCCVAEKAYTIQEYTSKAYNKN